MQFSLHLQFCDANNNNSSIYNNNRNQKGRNEIMSFPHQGSSRKDKVCEKCNYVHLVHCPISMMGAMCDRKQQQQTTTMKRHKYEAQNKRHNICRRQKRYANRSSINFDEKLHAERNDVFNQNDEIKIEGMQHSFSLFPLFCKNILPSQ